MPTTRSETSIASEAINQALSLARDAGYELRSEDWEGVQNAHKLLRDLEAAAHRAVVALEGMANRLDRRIGE